MRRRRICRAGTSPSNGNWGGAWRSRLATPRRRGRIWDENNINQELRTPASTTRPFAGFGDIEYYSFGGNSSYQAGTITVRKRFEHGLFFRANYTYGKSLDSNSGLNYAGDGGFAGAQDSRNLKLERGRSGWDMRHVFSMNFAWRLPFQQNVLVRGW